MSDGDIYRRLFRRRGLATVIKIPLPYISRRCFRHSAFFPLPRPTLLARQYPYFETVIKFSSERLRCFRVHAQLSLSLSLSLSGISISNK